MHVVQCTLYSDLNSHNCKTIEIIRLINQKSITAKQSTLNNQSMKQSNN